MSWVWIPRVSCGVPSGPSFLRTVYVWYIPKTKRQSEDTIRRSNQTIHKIEETMRKKNALFVASAYCLVTLEYRPVVPLRAYAYPFVASAYHLVFLGDKLKLRIRENKTIIWSKKAMPKSYETMDQSHEIIRGKNRWKDDAIKRIGSAHRLLIKQWLSETMHFKGWQMRNLIECGFGNFLRHILKGYK
jgi:hypothetical protein